jgi:hypothetical protein
VAWRVEYGYRWVIVAATIIVALVGIILPLLK